MKKRVRIPSQKPRLLLDLAKKVHDKHVSDGDTSLLKVLNWEEVKSLIDEAMLAQDLAERLKRQTVEAYQQRSVRLQPIVQILRDSRDILTGAYSKEMKVLGQWGFDVFDVRSNTVKPQEPTL